MVDGPHFHYSVALYPDFTALLAGASGASLTGEEVLTLAFEKGRALLQARAGAGKTSTLARLANEPSILGKMKIIDLSSVGVEFENGAVAEMWLQQVADRHGRPLLLGLDSLDAITPESGQRVLGAVDKLTSQDSSCAVIVCDRLGRRPLREERWALLGLSPVPRAEVVELAHSDTAPPWLASPLYLDLLRLGVSMTSPAAALRDALVRALQGNADALRRLADAVLAEREGSLPDSIPEGTIVGAAGADAVRNLEVAGLGKRVEGGLVQFRHQLVSAYLATYAAAGEEGLWDRELFEFLTVEGATFEPLGLLLEQVDGDKVDELVQRVDDWNFYAAAHLLAEDSKSEKRISRPLRDALLFLLGRRRLTQLPSTRRQVEDALLLHGSDLASRILATDTEHGLVELAEGQPNGEAQWWAGWLALFSLVPPSRPTGEHIEALTSPNGVLGWTSANVLVSAELTPDQTARVCELALRHQEPVVRWRAVHVLGGEEDADSAETCLRVFREDSSRWVKYGALRAFVSIAAHLDSAERRAALFLELANDSAAILASPKWKREVERSVLLEDRPSDWPDAVGLLLERLWAESDSVDEQDRWRRLSARLRTSWSGGLTS